MTEDEAICANVLEACTNCLGEMRGNYCPACRMWQYRIPATFTYRPFISRPLGEEFKVEEPDE